MGKKKKQQKLKSSTAISRYFENAVRARRIVGAGKFLKEQLGIDNQSPEDIYRSAIVMSVAAMDAYLVDRFIEGLASHLSQKKAKLSDEMSKMLIRSGFDVSGALQIIGTPRPYRRISNLVATQLSTYTAMNLDKIDELYLKAGLKDFCRRVEALSQKKRLLLSVRKVVGRRHSIAHAADRGDSGKLRKISYDEVVSYQNTISLFVTNCEKFLARSYPVSKGKELKIVTASAPPGAASAPAVLKDSAEASS